MHAWLYVLAVLITVIATPFAGVHVRHVAASSADAADSLDVPRPSSSSSSLSSSSSTASIDPATLATYEKDLFAQLGLKRRPHIIDRASIVIPDELMDIYQKMMAGHEHSDSVALPTPGSHTKSANTIRSYSHEDSAIDAKFVHHHKFRLYFNVTNIPDTDVLKAAELALSRRPLLHRGGKNHQNNNHIPQHQHNKKHNHKHHHQHHHQHQHHNVLVYDIVKPGVRGKSDPIFLLIDTRRIRTSGHGTIKLDVHPAVERWLRQPHENHGLLVHIAAGEDNRPAPDRHVRLRRSTATVGLRHNNKKAAATDDDAAEHIGVVVDDPTEDWARHQPFLFAYTDDQRHRKRAIGDAIASRKTRAAARRNGGRQKMVREICQRRSLYVDFSNVGWSDWIVAPPGYDAFYCHGECHFPQADHLNATNHAVVQALIHSVEPKMAPKVCCVPTQLNPISMLYLDDQNKVVLKNYQDMTVVGCGCR